MPVLIERQYNKEQGFNLIIENTWFSNLLFNVNVNKKITCLLLFLLTFHQLKTKINL